MRSAVKVSVHGASEVVDLDAPQGSYEVLRDAVGGYIEAVDITDRLTMWVNEEGKLTESPIRNTVGQMYFDKAFGAGRDTIVGDIIFTGGVDDEGDTIGLTEDQVKSILFITN